MAHTTVDVGISRHIFKYSDALIIEPNQRWFITSGTPGMDKNGNLPDGIEAQARLAWGNILEGLEKAGMGPQNIVKVVSTLINKDDIQTYGRVRAEILGDVRPAFMLSVVNQMVNPRMLVEVEVFAAGT
ncbi:Rid family hydrolase [Paraburkholderia sp. GAS82]|uniref:Rid family hydrolase n=1 Tax=Paraburkholderia sp. GAS82 TaxID=3035137 RepID=UPI003D2238BA